MYASFNYTHRKLLLDYLQTDFVFKTDGNMVIGMMTVVEFHSVAVEIQ